MKVVNYFNLKIFSFLIIVILNPLLCAADSAFFDQSLGNYAEELDAAREDGKKGILLMFEMDECPFCDRMAKTIINQPEVIKFYKQYFYIYRIDIEGDVEITDFHGKVTTEKDFAFRQHRVRATPVIAFFDLQGERIVRYTGATSTVEEFMWLGEFVVKEKYKEMSFTKYKKIKRKTSG
ncbi:MAG: thioredoxin family protein [Gammaproteobacteria bacterium]|nr:thioredoxin family protein [Gammaproteobacteria bacterium]MCW8910731.1 thioredoxin family protein [Gammaproteobacteria bacterium]MCW9004391.1 thioredoxin family protein [Gammaproteobacteria bacterium]MCW9056759.1 thioredoxin family protein [Gammaproteobacteria bacterium]